MTDVRAAALAGDLSFLDEQTLAGYVVAQRWFGSKTREVASLNVLGAVPLRRDAPLLVAALIETRFQPGTHEVYQLLLGLRPEAEGWSRDVIVHCDGWTVYEAVADPEQMRHVYALIGASAQLDEVEFHAVGALPAAAGDVRTIQAEQSNSSVVYGEELILKLYRRLEPGPNPELELLRFLTDHAFPHIPRLAGWYEFNGRLMDATLGILQDFIRDGQDGWDAALESLASPQSTERFLERLRQLGGITGEMHAVLGSEANDASFAPEELTGEALSLLVASIDEEIDQVFIDLPDGDPELLAIAHRGEEVRDRLRRLANVAAGGRVIRHHGDYHLGQTLMRPDDWAILDFEGEPARPLPERRRKRSPLRDVAGMLRSFAYVASAGSPPEGWEDEARRRFLDGYLETADPALLPQSRATIEQLLAVFELEKAVYELRYEINHRPDWVRIPVRGITRLLEMEL
jgi:trehalose synthase-fused probable maltokinase